MRVTQRLSNREKPWRELEHSHLIHFHGRDHSFFAWLTLCVALGTEQNRT